MMGDRNFLLNQAILSSSNQTQRIAFNKGHKLGLSDVSASMPFSGASTTTNHHNNNGFHEFTLGRKQVEEHAKTELDGKEQPETFRDDAGETKADENSS